ncbi:unnamed protein product [Camellia sinensis]
MSVVVKVLEGSVDVESNLDFSFTTPVVPRAITVAGHQEDDIGVATPLFASALSGPSLLSIQWLNCPLLGSTAPQLSLIPVKCRLAPVL